MVDVAKKFIPRKLDILKRIQGHGPVTARSLADELGIPLRHASRLLAYYHNQGLLTREPTVMNQGGIRYKYFLGKLGSKKILFFK